MDEQIGRAVNRVIETMYERVGEEITADDLARTAMYSKFHFSRAFRRITGVSPGRFLSALRFQEAKRLLTTTALSVADISNQVGYSSLGTFSYRFKQSVGVSPTEYRRIGGNGASDRMRQGQADSRSGSICGQLTWTHSGDCGKTFVGLFRGPVPQGPPACFTMLTAPGAFQLDGVPEGRWYLIAHGVTPQRATGNGSQELVGTVGRRGLIAVPAGVRLSGVDVALRPMRAVDLPVVFAPFVAKPMRTAT